MIYDLVIKNGRVIDGSGMPSYSGDVGVKDGRIVEVGRIEGEAKRTIDAGGHAIAPGFIDNHTHFDAQVIWDPLCTDSCFHGVTTVVFGNCSMSLAPAREGAEEQYILAQMLSRVEAIPIETLQAGVTWSWGTVGEYLDAMDRRLGVNVGYLIGHSAIRRYVMGDDSQEREESTPEELEAMKEVVREGMRSGALGLSFTRNNGHFDLRGKLLPGSVASLDEVFALAGILKEFGAGVIQCGSASAELSAELYQVSGRPVFHGIAHTYADPEEWKRRLAKVEASVKSGNRAFPQLATRPTDQRFNLKQCQLFDQLPTWQRVLDGTHEEKLRDFRDPETRRQLHVEAVDTPMSPNDFFNRRWDLLFVTKPALEKNADLKGKSIVEIAESQGVDILDAFLDLALEEDLETRFVSHVMGGDEEAMRVLLNSPYTVIGLSDSGAHVAYDPGYGASTYLLGHWVANKGVMSLEAAVRKLTFDQAALLGMYDRGLIRPGMAADLVVFDPDGIGLQEMEVVRDLPDGGPRLKQLATGIDCTVVNGEVLIEKGEHTGAYSGRVLRNSVSQLVAH